MTLSDKLVQRHKFWVNHDSKRQSLSERSECLAGPSTESASAGPNLDQGRPTKQLSYKPRPCSVSLKNITLDTNLDAKDNKSYAYIIIVDTSIVVLLCLVSK